MVLLSRFVIKGHSMEPTISQGQTVLVSAVPYLFSKPKIGDIVVIRHFDLTVLTPSLSLKVRVDSGVASSYQNDKESGVFVKRITKIDGEKYFVSGDNEKDSLDSKDFGWITIGNILGKVVYFL